MNKRLMILNLQFEVKILFHSHILAAMKKKQVEELNPLNYFSRVRIGIYMLSVYLEMTLDISNCPG